MDKNVILASELNQDSVKLQVNKLVKKFISTSVTKKLKELKQSTTDNNFDWNENKELITEEFIKSREVEEFRKIKTEEISQTIGNYKTLRNNINNLNEIDQFSAIFEKLNLQTKELKSFEELIRYSTYLFDKQPDVNAILSDKKQYIEDYIKQYDNEIPLNFKKKYNRLFDENDILDILLTLREMYEISKNIDSIELYDKYDMLDNLFVSNLLSQVCFKNISTTSIIDIFNKSSNELTKLVSKRLVSNKMLGILLNNSINDNSYPIISNNSITCYDNTYVTTETNQKLYVKRTVGEILLDITNEDYKNIEKSQRKQIYMTYDGIRPNSEEYHYWNGFQILDIDPKAWVDRGGNIQLFKQKLYEYLSDYHWFLFITFSSSHKGVHIWTKVVPPHHIHLDISKNNRLSKYWYMINYYTKTSVVYDIIYELKDIFNFGEEDFVKSGNESKYDTGFEFKHLDNSVGRITSGIRVPYDSNVLINNNFLDLHVSYGIHKTLTSTSKIILRNTTISKRWFERINELTTEIEDIDGNQMNISNITLKGYDTSKISEIPISQIKYSLRYNICNTLASLIGKEGLPLAHKILRSKECKNVDEINNFYASALRNKKEPTKYAVDILSKIGLVKHIDEKFEEELTDKYKLFMKKQIEKMLENDKNEYDIYLKDGEYLGHYENDILTNKKYGLRNDKINIIHAPPGGGKTEMVKQLATKKRVLLVLPFISTIKNKVENDPEITKIFEVFYDDKDINKMEYGVNCCMTFDKFSRCNYEKISKQFDFIFLDESHLITNSQYRINATSKSLKKLKQLYWLSSNDPFAAKIILCTGTPTGDHFFFGKIGNFIRVYKKSHQKNMSFHICGDSLDVSSRMAYKIYQLLQDKYTIIIPSNQGNIWMENMIGQVEYLLTRNVKYGYYKRENIDLEICKLINEENTVGDFEIIFCSNYLSVGIDITDTDKNFATIYTDSRFSAFEIEQFNSRIRRKGIDSHYFIKTLDANGEADMTMFEEPSLQLRLTNDDILNFKDDKEISNAKQEFLATYDPVLKTITTPGFAVVGGKIRFEKEQYELISFENKYEECFQHPLKIARELSKYGYNVSVSKEFEGLSVEDQKILKEVGRESAIEEKVKKNQLLIGTFIDLVNINKYENSHGLEFNDTVNWIKQHKYEIIEDRNAEKFVDVKFNVFAQPESCIVKSKTSLDKMLPFVKFLLTKYSTNKILEIFDKFIDEKGIIHLIKLQRTVNLLKLIESSDQNEMSEPVSRIIEQIYEYVDNFIADDNKFVTYKSHQKFIEKISIDYIEYLEINIRTKYGLDKITEAIRNLFDDIAIRNSTRSGVRFSYNKLPDTDSTTILNRRSVDSLINNLFRITSEIVNTKNKSRKKHITLESQNY
jgi:hypothetical protein